MTVEGHEHQAAVGGPLHFHITPRPGRWLHDPNGPVAWQGRVHLFHQPGWGHAVSDDLVRWTILDDAFTPTPGGPDRGGTWSGCAIVHDDLVHAIYTGVDGSMREQVVCVATADGDLTTWAKWPDPVITAPPPGLAPLGFRDPYVIRHDGRWLCVMGAGEPGIGRALAYTSDDLRTWTFEGTLLERASAPGDPAFTGEIWECPFLVPLGGRHVLGLSVWWQEQQFGSAYVIGDLDGTRFQPGAVGRLDHGPDLYAPTAMVDPAGRVLLWGWVWEAHAEGVNPYGRGGALTVTRELTMRDGDLWVHPVKELESLRGDRLGTHDGPLLTGTSVILAPDAGDAFDLLVEVPAGLAARLGVEILASPDGDEVTVVFLDPAEGVAGIDTRRSVRDGLGRAGVSTAPLADVAAPLADAAGSHDIRILVDGSIVEAFVDGRAMTARVSGTGPTSRAVRLVADGDIDALSARLWAVTEHAIEFAP